jgi:hypothetical protein
VFFIDREFVAPLVEQREESEEKRCKPISTLQISEDIFEDRETNSKQDQYLKCLVKVS